MLLWKNITKQKRKNSIMEEKNTQIPILPRNAEKLTNDLNTKKDELTSALARITRLEGDNRRSIDLETSVRILSEKMGTANQTRYILQLLKASTQANTRETSLFLNSLKHVQVLKG